MRRVYQYQTQQCMQKKTLIKSQITTKVITIHCQILHKLIVTDLSPLQEPFFAKIFHEIFWPYPSLWVRIAIFLRSSYPDYSFL